jgi:hypothetical protein
MLSRNIRKIISASVIYFTEAQRKRRESKMEVIGVWYIVGKLRPSETGIFLERKEKEKKRKETEWMGVKMATFAC